MPRKRIRTAKRLDLARTLTKFAFDLVLDAIVDRVLVPREIVRSAEHDIAPLARRLVDARALMWTCLGVSGTDS